MRLSLRKREFILSDVFVAVAVAVVVVAKALYCLLRNVLTVPSCSAGGIVMCDVILRSDQRCNIFKRENERTRSLFLSGNKLWSLKYMTTYSFMFSNL